MQPLFQHEAQVLITLGGIFLLGLLADVVARRSPLPRVTLLLLIGLTLGPSGLDVLPPFAADLFPLLSKIALAMVAFLLGGRLTLQSLKTLGNLVISFSIAIVLVTAISMFAVLTLLGVEPAPAILLAAIATSTAPAATVDVVTQLQAKGRFSDILVRIVAIDDAWGLILFTLCLSAAGVLVGNHGNGEALRSGLIELSGSLLLGLALGIPFAYITGRIRPGEPTLAEALGAVLLVAGLADYFGLSYILASMALGSMIANIARHHDYPFHAIEGIEWPFLILFFLLAGSTLHIGALADAGGLLLAYIVVRVVARLAGSQLGGLLCNADDISRRYMGLALLPQAGVAIGMALIAVQEFPQFRDLLMPIVLAATVIFELTGPVATRWVLLKVGDATET